MAPMRTGRIHAPKAHFFAWACLLILLSLSMPAVAQEPWEGWSGVPSDGIYDFRFGMDRNTAGEICREMDLDQRPGRLGTMRFDGKLDGRTGDLVLEFQDDDIGGLGGRLCRISLIWRRFVGPPAGAIRFFERLQQRLQQRYDSPVAVQEANSVDLSTGRKGRFQLYQGPQMQALLKLRARRAQLYDVQLVLEYPQLCGGEEEEDD